MKLFQSILTLHSLANYILFIVAAYTWFRRNNNPTRMNTAIKAGACASLAIQVFELSQIGDPSFFRLAISEATLFASTLLFVLALTSSNQLSEAFSTDSPVFLTSSGVYSYLRHPFYTSYLLSYIGGMIASSSILIMFQTLIMFGLYFSAAKFEEEKFRNSGLKNEYEKYQRDTGMFIPRILNFKSPRELTKT